MVNGVARVIEALIVSRAQTKQVQALVQMAASQQPQTVVVQTPAPQEHTFSLNYGTPPQQQQPMPDPLGLNIVVRPAGDVPAPKVNWEATNSTNPPAKIVVYYRGDAVQWLEPGDTMTISTTLGQMDLKAFAYLPVKNQDNPFQMQDKRIPLAIEKEEGQNKISFVWPKGIMN